MGVQVSYLAASYVKSQILDNVNGFNAQIQASSATYGTSPFIINQNNLFFGRYDVPSLIASGSLSQNVLPCAIVNVAKSDASGKFSTKVTPSTFSGIVIVSIDFVLIYPGKSVPFNGGLVYFAMEDALVNTFNKPIAATVTPPQVIYDNEVVVEQGRMEQQGTQWLQWIPATLFFTVTV